MAVLPESLDILEKADVPPVQARAIVRAIELEIAGAKDTLATKHDLLLLREDVHQEMAVMRTEIGTLRTDMTTLRTDVATLRTDVATLRTDMATMRTDMADWRGELRAELHASASSTTRQMCMALLGQMAVLLGFAYFFALHVR